MVARPFAFFLRIVAAAALAMSALICTIGAFLLVAGLFGMLTNRHDGHASYLSLVVYGLLAGAFGGLLALPWRLLRVPNPSFQRTATRPLN